MIKTEVKGEALTLEDELKTHFIEDKEANKTWVSLTFRDVEVKKRIPSHVLKMNSEAKEFHLGLIMTEIEMTMGQRIGVKPKYIHDALVRQITH